MCTFDATFIEMTDGVEIAVQGEYKRGEPEASKGEHGGGDAAGTVPKQGEEQGIEADEDIHGGLGRESVYV